jgi:UDP-glucose:(heptosyl)LPS alpha-1,3-glucosyltransferase
MKNQTSEINHQPSTIDHPAPPLAFCLYKYFPHGGLQRDMLRIALACRARGHAVEIYTSSWAGARPESLRIHIHQPRALTNHGGMRQYHAWLAGRLRENPPACVVGFNKMPGLDVYYAADGCYQAKASEQHGPLYRLGPRYRLYQAFEKAVFGPGAQTQVLMLSPIQESLYVRCYGTPPQRIHRLPPNVARDRIAGPDAPEIRRAFRQTLGLGEQDKLVLQVGSGFRTKGLDRSIRALAGLPQALVAKTRLYVVGDDNRRPYLRLARRLGVTDRVVFLGPRDDVAHILVAADLLVHPAYHENTGTVLLEALAAGLPVVASGVCGYAHYIEEAQAGWVLPEPFEQDRFTRGLQAALERRDLSDFGRRGADFARREDLYGMVDAAVAVIEKTTQAIAECGLRSADSGCDTNSTSAIHTTELTHIWLAEPFRTLWQGQDPFERADALEGEVFRRMAARRTIRISVQGGYYFAKIHHGIGWREILKELLHLKRPVLGAQNEWRALELLSQIGVPTMTPVAYGQRGRNPARMWSFLITEELTGTTSLEDLGATWAAQPPSFRLRKALTEQLASIVRRMHAHGLNHRDCYLCHFHLDAGWAREPVDPDRLRLHVIDLHRAQIRRRTPRRWIVKDLAGLYFSALGVGLTRTDRLRFIRAYEQKPLRETVRQHRRFWRHVERVAFALHRRLST